MKRFYLIYTFLISISASAQLNIQFRSNLPYTAAATSNIGGYVDHLGNEYALVGWSGGLSIVDVTDPDTPVVRFNVPGNPSTWREVKTYRDYAYVTTEACCDGLQIIDLTQLPAAINTITYTGDSSITGSLNTIHALHIDTALAFLYVFGSNISAPGANAGFPIILDISDPLQPHYKGRFVLPSGNSYVHDGYVENDTAYYCHIYEGIVSVVNQADKSNPVLLAIIQTPSQFPHNAWISPDHNTLFTTDEVPDSYLAAYDISDLSNITELSRFQTAPGTGAIIHNTHILNDYAITSWYTEGVVITDVSRPQNPVEVGHYDTYPSGGGPGIAGAWGVYPFLPSGTIVASDINNGLFVLTPTYVRGCYLEGQVTDSMTSIPLSQATITLLGQNISRLSTITGHYYSGTATPGTYDIEVSKPGYFTKVLTGISLAPGVVTQLDVALVEQPLLSVTGTVTDSASGLPLPGASVTLYNNDFSYPGTCDSLGQFNLVMYSGTYNIVAGKWGHKTSCTGSQLIDAATPPLTIPVTRGYYDDFTFDFGWTSSGSSPNAWERGEPVGTFQSTQTINPEFDSPLDCGEYCFVTDNQGGQPEDHDVDNGTAKLVSPVFDATIYQNPVINYYRWFINRATTGLANDTIFVYLTNGSDTVLLEARHSGSPGSGIWMYRSFDIASYITPSLSMQLILEVTDYSPDDVCEAGLDKFFISGLIVIGLPEHESLFKAKLYPESNPFTGTTGIRYETTGTSEQEMKLCVVDMLGKKTDCLQLSSAEGTVDIGDNLAPGIYYVLLLNHEKILSRLKICKLN